jgi:hypothetical protein
MKKRDFIRLISVLALPAIVFLSVGCAGEEQALEYTAACNTILTVAGTWNAAFRCDNDECVAGEDTYLVSQDLSDLTTVTAEITASTLEGDVGVIFEGKLCGSVFTFSATNPGNDEAGSWTFSDANSFTKSTTFGGGANTCIGAGTKPPLPLPTPFVCL